MSGYFVRRTYFQSIITTGRFVLPVAIFITIACWVMVYILTLGLPARETAYASRNLPDAGLIPLWIDKSVCLLIYLTIGYMLIRMNNAFGLIRAKASVHTSIFLLLVAACPPLQQLSPGDIATLLFVVALYLLFNAYQHRRSSGYLFHAFLFVGLGSLIFPQITLLAPILLIGAYNFKALDLRSLLAAFIGWSLPYWFLFGYAFYSDRMELFYRPFIKLVTFCPIDFSIFTVGEFAVLGYSLVLFMVASIHCFIQSYKDKIRTRVHLRFFVLLNVCIYMLIVLQPALCTSLLPLSLVGVSMLTSHMFVLTNSKASNIFFISSVIGLILLFYINVWMLL